MFMIRRAWPSCWSRSALPGRKRPRTPTWLSSTPATSARRPRKKSRRGEALLIAVAGCVAQAEGAEIRRRAPYVDLVFGPQTYHRLPQMVARALCGGGVVDTSFPAEPKFDHLPQTRPGQGMTAFLTVQEGCDKFCTFCVVPYTRGAEYSRPAAQILDEARGLVASGARARRHRRSRPHPLHDLASARRRRPAGRRPSR